MEHDGFEDAVRHFEQRISHDLSDLVRTLQLSEQNGLYRAVMERVERPLFALVLEATGGNQLKAARLLGMNRNTLRKRLRLLGLASRRQHRIAVA